MVADMKPAEEARAGLDQRVPMPRNDVMEPESVASLLAWLASSENTQVTGQAVSIDGESDTGLRGKTFGTRWGSRGEPFGVMAGANIW